MKTMVDAALSAAAERHAMATGTGADQPWLQPGYESRGRFASYWHQLDAVRRRAPARMLEVGIGSGTVATLLRHRGVQVETVDLHVEVSPRVVADVMHLPFPAEAFDLALCCQVLEHLPLDAAIAAVRELRRVSRRWIVLSVPDASPWMRLIVPQPGRGEREVVLRRWWRPTPARPLNEREHCWELGTVDLPLRRWMRLLHSEGVDVLRHYRVFENPYHHFFELEVRR